MKGWFDAFRHNGGPTLYDHSNRTAVTADVATITFCLIFITLFVAFVIIFPGIRKERFTTFTTVTLSLFVGAVILVSTYASDWHVAEYQITSAYRAFSAEKIRAGLGIHIGLQHVNITLKSLMVSNETEREIDFNERFFWDLQGDESGYHEGLRKGLPFPILTVAEYLSLDEEGFAWARMYRSAGYYCGIALWSSFASWGLMNILLLVVPRYGGYMMLVTGSLMLAADLLYYLLIPHRRPLIIRFEDVSVSLKFGWTFWLVLATGLLCISAGVAISILEFIHPHKFSTVLELDYGTPYDRHIIIEESHVRKRKPRLEEPPSAGFGSRIFRRLSKRGENGEFPKEGIDNPALEIEAPKSPWRHPPYERVVLSRQSQKSNKSVNFGNLARPSEALDVGRRSSSRSQSEWSGSSYNSDNDDERDEIERISINTIPTPPPVDFQQQFRTPSRSQSSSSRTSSRRSMDLVVSMERQQSERRSGLGSISARISAAAEADRQARLSQADGSFPAELW